MRHGSTLAHALLHPKNQPLFTRTRCVAGTRPPKPKPRITVGTNPHTLPRYLTVAETASLLRRSRKAIYMMIERDTLPGVRRIGVRRTGGPDRRRLLIHYDTLLDWLDQKCAPSPQEERR
jgi:predicted DNA-binding transcriptional regulator AlpA